MKRINGLSRWLNVLLILTTFVAYLSPYISPTTFWPISVFGLGVPSLFVLNFIFFLYWIFRRQKYFVLSLGCILLGWSHLTSNFGFGSNNTTSDNHQISIVNFNTRNLSQVYFHKNKKEQAKQIKAFENWLTKNNVDIFLFQEITSNRIKQVNKIVKFQHLVQPKGKRIAILSRYPVIASGTIEFSSVNHLAIWADLEVGKNKIIRSYTLHLQSSYLDRDAIEAVAAGKVREKETWFGAWELIKVYKKHASARVKQAEKILEHIQKSPYPVVVGGDFNEPPTSYVYHQFNRQLKDAFRSAGRGFGSTYAGKIPLMKIDFLFYDPRLRILKHEIERKPFSDHYPVRTHLTW